MPRATPGRATVTVRLPGPGPGIDESQRLDYEKEDSFGYRWWPLPEVLTSSERFYPGILLALLSAFFVTINVLAPIDCAMQRRSPR